MPGTIIQVEAKSLVGLAKWCWMGGETAHLFHYHWESVAGRGGAGYCCGVNLVPVGFLRGPFAEKFGTPRQAGLVPGGESVIELVPPWDAPEAVRGLEGHSHLWVLFGFHLNGPVSETRTTVRPPRLGGNERVGVFATRSPYRPNPVGLSLVRLLGVAPGRIRVGGADVVDGTPVYDLKPWLPWADTPEPGDVGGGGGFAAEPPGPVLEVVFAGESGGHPLAGELARILALDPRPAYQRDDPDRIHGMTYAGHEVRWTVDDGRARLSVMEIRISGREGSE